MPLLRSTDNKPQDYVENLKDLHQNLLSADEKRKVLKELDLFVLDNSMRETTIGQLRGHTLENKWQIYDEVKKCGFDHTIVASFNHMTRLGDTFIQQLHDRGEDMTNKYAFAELADKSKDGVPQEFPIPIGLTKSKELGIRNVIIEMDLAYFDYDYGKWSEEQIWDLMRKRIEWTRQNIYEGAMIYFNFRDFSDAMQKFPGRLLKVVQFLSAYRPTISGLMYEDLGGTFPEELGVYTRAVRNLMTINGWEDANLLIHMHYQWGLSNASNIECLANGANGMWAGICEEGAAMGHSSTNLAIYNLIRMGNTKVVKKFKCQALRNAAIAVTKIVTGKLPPAKTPVVGERALDRVFGFPAFEPENMGGFSLQDFLGEEAPIRISTMADNKMIRQALINNFGTDPQFTLDMGNKMKELMLDDMRYNRKEEYQSPFGLSVLFDRAGGQFTEAMSEVIAKTKLKSDSIRDLIAELRERWDEWDLRENDKDDMLDFNSFYNGFMAPYFGCYRCDTTRKALKAIDMDNDGHVDWNEFLVYLKWAGNAYPDIETAQELLDKAFIEGLLPAMQDVLIGIAAEKK